MSREEIKEQLTSDTATLTESLYSFVDMIFEKGYIDKRDFERALEIDLSDAPETYIWSVEDVKRMFYCSEEEASEVIESIQEKDLLNQYVNEEINDVGDFFLLKPRD
tara:strand:- start:656 stop:976 length:321 start_codon:yes stop_codon:yes gene_type:complete